MKPVSLAKRRAGPNWPGRSSPRPGSGRGASGCAASRFERRSAPVRRSHARHPSPVRAGAARRTAEDGPTPAPRRRPSSRRGRASAGSARAGLRCRPAPRAPAAGCDTRTGARRTSSTRVAIATASSLASSPPGSSRKTRLDESVASNWARSDESSGGSASRASVSHGSICSSQRGSLTSCSASRGAGEAGDIGRCLRQRGGPGADVDRRLEVVRVVERSALVDEHGAPLARRQRRSPHSMPGPVRTAPPRPRTRAAPSRRERRPESPRSPPVRRRRAGRRGDGGRSRRRALRVARALPDGQVDRRQLARPRAGPAAPRA